MTHNKIREKNEKKSNSFYNIFIKRFFDIIFSSFILIILLPIIIILSLIQIFTSGFPIFYTPLRGGYENKNFKIIKFRTMIKNADKIGGGTTALNDKRITKFGFFLRKTKLDEIPQFVNVLMGQMSIVGPRPELVKYTSNYTDQEKLILDVKPGITDFSSIHFINLDEIVGNKDPDLEYEEKVLKKKNLLRIKYVKEISFKTDSRIFFMTIYKVLKKIIKFLWRNNGKDKNKK